MDIQRITWTRLATLVVTVVATGAAGCTDTSSEPMAPPTPVAITGVSVDPSLLNGAEVGFGHASADSVRAHYASTDSSDTGVTPWVGVASGVVTVLGLRAGTTYNVTLEAYRDGVSVLGGAASYTVPPLPAALAEMKLVLISGSPPASGYTLTAMPGPDSHGYLVIFDRSGDIRWYHDFGVIDLQDAKQQTNGDFTVFVGNSIGSNAAPGAFVELTPAGDSVRAITAVGSPYTDGHELLVTSDAKGRRIADYLFGYDIRNVDESASGGTANEQLAGHQLLRVSATGAVDTLMQGWGYWTRADRIDPPISDQDIDHPNSIDFDTDGGVVASFRNLGAIVKLDPVTHHVVWQFGGARNQFTFIGDPFNGFGGQHSVRVLPNGHFLVFDNGVTHVPQTSRAVEYAVDQSAKTATMVWQYVPASPLFNEFTGSVQRLANGNTIVAWTNYGLIDEVAPDGTLVNRTRLDYASGAPSNSAYRAIRIDNLYRYNRP